MPGSGRVGGGGIAQVRHGGEQAEGAPPGGGSAQTGEDGVDVDQAAVRGEEQVVVVDAE